METFWAIGVVVMLLLLLVLVFFCFLLISKPRLLMDEGEKIKFDFINTFGISPLVPNYYKGVDSWCVVVQSVVDNILKSKANLLHEAFEMEARWTKVVADKPAPSYDDLEHSRNVKQGAEKSKRSFWQTHNIALCFVHVRPSYKDYLLSDEEWRTKMGDKGGLEA